jgi:pimeloyl-ACP methyl ester carboxylesterase
VHQLFVEEEGNSDSSSSWVVLLHAGIADGTMWDSQAQALARFHRVIRYDHRGMGRSPWWPGPFTLAGDLETVMSSRKIGEAALVGCSMGGGAAIDFAIQHPDRVTKLVVIGSALGGWPETAEDRETWERIGRLPLDEQNELLMKMWVDGTRDRSDPAVRARVAEMNARNLARAIAENQTEAGWLDPPAIDRLGEIRAPTLIIAGESDQPRILQIADRLEEGIADARKVVMPGAHMLNLEHPDELNRLIADFLRP